jgi:antitoxin component YwqK of YwqJK toxin-antitoxin module
MEESKMKHTLLIITALMLVVGCGSDSIKLDINNLIDRGGLKYAPNDDEPYTGDVFELYEDGKKKLDGNYRNGLMNGKWTYYHENGQIHGQGRFIDGDGSNPSESSGIPFNGRSGRWKFWYENGQKSSEKTYKDGKQNGKWTEWYENGQKRGEGTFKDGKYDGLNANWYENGQKSFEGTYKNGILIGKYELWFEDGTKEWEYYYNYDGTRDSTKSTTRWYESGQKWYNGYIKTINDTTSEWNGLYTRWHENGQKEAEETFKDGIRIESTYWDEEGNVIDDE